ncbi:MAG: hypothetical protein SFY81_11445 [Verrucomicrobiota bacterium]|nr:hypothetical protein [Verrucomicrobiota bacterium]
MSARRAVDIRFEQNADSWELVPIAEEEDFTTFNIYLPAWEEMPK